MTVEDWLNELLDSPSTMYGFPVLILFVVPR